MTEIAAARDCGILACHVCGLLSFASPALRKSRCPRCGERLHDRKPQSLHRSLALLLAAAILYIPANALPIMHTSTLLYDEDDTILSGVVALWSSGSWPLSMLVFFVSILVPTLKLMTLSLLILSPHYRWRWRARERTQLYRLIEFVGRWSMLDVFVVALLVALVQLRGIAIIRAGPGAIAFAAVVVLTMYAAQAFDPRLMWRGANP